MLRCEGSRVHGMYVVAIGGCRVVWLSCEGSRTWFSQRDQLHGTVDQFGGRGCSTI